MTISVVIATYNRAALLESTLDELGRQAFEPGDEVIVVDNASTDRTPEVIARAIEKFPVRIRHLRETTPGKTPAMNRGIAVARGDILALTDDDVFLGDAWIATLRKVFEDRTIALVGGRIDPRWERPAPRWLSIEQPDGYGHMASPLALLHYGAPQPLGVRTALGANMAVRRSVLHSLGGFSLHLGRQRGTLLCGEDHDLCQRAVAAGYRCEYRPELRVEHWVPAERTRMAYFLRWFFWSGVTDGVLRSSDSNGHKAAGQTVRHYLLRRLLTAPVVAIGHSITGRTAEAAEQAMDAAFAVGYITQRMGIWRLTAPSGTPCAEQPDGGSAGDRTPGAPPSGKRGKDAAASLGVIG
jgi:GT2 family glycosyltransferase